MVTLRMVLVLTGMASIYVSLMVDTMRMKGREVLGTSAEVLGSKRCQREDFGGEGSNKGNAYNANNKVIAR